MNKVRTPNCSGFHQQINKVRTPKVFVHSNKVWKKISFISWYYEIPSNPFSLKTSKQGKGNSPPHSSSFLSSPILVNTPESRIGLSWDSSSLIFFFFGLVDVKLYRKWKRGTTKKKKRKRKKSQVNRVYKGK